MAITINDNTAIFAEGEALTDTSGTWTSIGSGAGFGVCCDVKRVGCASISKRLSNARGGGQFAKTVSVNMCDCGTPRGMVTVWAQLNGRPTCTACTGGVTIRVGSSTTQYREWQVATGASYAGGWGKFTVFICSGTHTVCTGTPAWCAVDYFALQFDSSTVFMGNVNAVWIDQVKYLTAAQIANGTAAGRIDGTTTACDNTLFNQIFANSTNCTVGYMTRRGGVLGLNMPIQIGGWTGIQTFRSNEEIVVVNPLTCAADGRTFIKFRGHAFGITTHDWGEKIGSGATAIGSKGTTIIKAPGRAKFGLDANCANINVFTMYGNTFDGVSCPIGFGTVSNPLGSSCDTAELVDNTIKNGGQITRKINATTRLEVDNIQSFSSSSVASIDLTNETSISINNWIVVQGPGFQQSASAGCVTTVQYDWNVFTKPYITLQTCETWQSRNPNWTITNQTELNFGGGTLTGASVQEQFKIDVTVQQASGTKIQNARIKVMETSPSVAIVNSDSTNACGKPSSDIWYLRRLYQGAASCALTTISHTGQSLKVHRYGRLPFAGSICPVNAQVTTTTTLLVDPYVVASECCAVADGSVKPTINIASCNPHSIIKFQCGSGILNVGNTVNGGTSTATGVVKEIIEGDSTSGTVVLISRNATNYTPAGETLTESGCSSDWTATFVACSQQCFTNLYCAGNKTACTPRTVLQAYEHQSAKLGEATLDTADNWDKIITWGRCEHGHFLQGVSGAGTCSVKFQTVRNSTTGSGWVVTNLAGLGQISQFTDDCGNAFIPQATVQVKVTVVEAEDFVTKIACARVNVQNSSTSEIIMNSLTNACGIATVCIPFTTCVPVFVRARKETEDYVKIPATITSSGLNITAAVKDDNRYTPT